MAVTEELGKGEARSAEGGLPPSTRLETAGLVLGVIGLTAVVFGAILYAIDPDVLPLAVANVAVGAFGLVIYAATNRRNLGRAIAGRSTRYMILEALIVAGVLAAASLANYFAAKSKKEWDLTRDGLFSLHERSIVAARSLEQDVRIIGFFRPADDARSSLREAVALYQLHSDRISLEFQNRDAPDPELVQRLAMDAKSPPIVVMAESGQYAKVKIPTEEEMTNAIIKVAERRQRVAYFLAGHQEAAIDDPSEDGLARAAANLRNEGFRVETLSLIDRGSVPTDASVVIVAGPKRPLLPNEVDVLGAWIARGGRAVILVDPGTDTGLDAIFTRFGALVGDDTIADMSPASRAAGQGPTVIVVSDFEQHAITEKLRGGAMMFVGARSVQPRFGLEKLTVTTLVQTGATSWGETAYRGTDAYARDENDVPGPVPVVIAALEVTAGHPEKTSDEARVVISGDSDLIDNRWSQMTANELFFVYAVNWAVGDEHKIAIPPPRRESSRLIITEVVQYGIMFFSVNLLPLFIVGVGFSVWAVRRRK